MRVRVFHSFLFCAIACLVAFSVGIWVAWGGGPEKVGPSGAEQGTAHPRSVRVILPDTLDGQAIPGHGTGLADRRRDLSPVYPTSPAPQQEKPIVASATTPGPRAQDQGEAGSSTQASMAASEIGASQARDEDWVRQAPLDEYGLPAGDPQLFRHLAPASRHARGGYSRHQGEMAVRRARPAYAFGTFARLSASDHGR
jgi:hypothetical protein